jgi:hypothetical protein
MSPKTKAPAPSRKLKDGRAEALARMTKTELLKTVKTLDARVTKLLNRIAQLEAFQWQTPVPERTVANDARLPNPFVGKFPWE